MSITVRELVTTWGFQVDQGPLQKAESGVSNLKNSLIKVIALVGGLRLASAGLNVAAEFEQANISFRVMLKSAELAKKTIGDIREFARKTPFTFPGMIDAGKRLLAFGFEAKKLIPTMQVLGDITAGVGTEKLPQLILALGQVRAATKLRGQELRQFTETGVPIVEALAAQMKVPIKAVADLVSQGKVSFDDTYQALASLTKEGGQFFGLMKEQSLSWLGILSNIKDFILILTQDIGAKILPKMKEIAGEFLNFLEVNQELITSKTVHFFERLFSAFQKIRTVLTPIALRIWEVIQAFGGLEAVTIGAMKYLGLIFGLTMLSKIGAVAMGIAGLVTGVKTLGTAALVAQAKMLLIPLAIGAAIAAMVLAIEDVKSFIEGKDSVFGKFNESFMDLSKGVQMMIRFFLVPINGLISGIQTIIDLIDVFRGKMSVGGFIGNTMKRLVNLTPMASMIKGNDTLTSAIGLRTRFNDDLSFRGKGNSVKQTVTIAEGAIKVDGSGDPAAVGQVVVQELGGKLRSILSEGYRDLLPATE